MSVLAQHLPGGQKNPAPAERFIDNGWALPLPVENGNRYQLENKIDAVVNYALAETIPLVE